jgi:hypothetical protein
LRVVEPLSLPRTLVLWNKNIVSSNSHVKL